MNKANTEEIKVGRDGLKYKYVYGKYGEIQSISEFQDKPQYTSLLKTLKPATKIKQFLGTRYPNNSLAQSAFIQFPLDQAIKMGYKKNKKRIIKICGTKKYKSKK